MTRTFPVKYCTYWQSYIIYLVIVCSNAIETQSSLAQSHYIIPVMEMINKILFHSVKVIVWQFSFVLHGYDNIYIIREFIITVLISVRNKLRNINLSPWVNPHITIWGHSRWLHDTEVIFTLFVHIMMKLLGK